MKKNIWAIFFLFIAITFSFSKDKILHTETKYFDIIFDEKSKTSAQEIYNYADKLFEELCVEYKIKPDFKIPVVLTSKTKIHNAYFSNFNCNHIVIYDTIPNESFIEFSNNIKSTFLHELTHLVSTNTKNGFWKTTSKIFGDIYNPGYYITMTTFFNEGASVNKESKNGEGRLNDGFFLHDIKQAKISNIFPEYTDCFGARTVYPFNSASYTFGSAWAEYIIEKYGMEKYAEFWHNGINSFSTPTSVFKKTYGISMKKEWKNFYNSINIDGIEKNPLALKEITKTNFKNKNLHLYSVLGKSNNKTIILDETTNSVFIDNKKLFTNSNLIDAKLTFNGKYIVTTSIDKNHLDTKIKSDCFNLETRKWAKIKCEKINQLCIFEKNEKKYIACIKNESQKVSLEIRTFDKKNLLIHSIDFAENKIPYSLCCDKNGNLWFLYSDSLKFHLCKLSFNNKKIEFQSFALNNINPKYLSVSENDSGKTTLLFSYSEQKSFPRLAIAELNDNEIKLCKLEKDISGGIYSPILKDNKIIYAAKFWTTGSIYKLDFNAFLKQGEFSETTVKGNIKSIKNNKKMLKQVQHDVGSLDDVKNLDDVEEKNEITKNFSFSEYKKMLHKGTSIIPLSILNSYYISPSVYLSTEEDCLSLPYTYLAGITLIKSNPWNTKYAFFTSGYSPTKKAGGMGLTLIGNSSSKNFIIQNTTNSIYNKNGFMQVNNNFRTSFEIQIGKISRLVFSETNFLLYGKLDMNDKTQNKYYLNEDKINKNYFYNKNILSLNYNTTHKTGAKTHEVTGFIFGMNLKNIYATTNSKKEDSIFDDMIHYKNDKIQFTQIYPSLIFYLPKIIPLDCKGQWTYNLPIKTYGSLFQFNDSFITFLAETTILSYEIQKGLGIIPLYMSTISLNAFFQNSFITGQNRNMEISYLRENFNNLKNMQQNKYAGGSLAFTIGGNTGVLANPTLNISIMGKVFYCIEGSKKGETQWNISSIMNFALF